MMNSAFCMGGKLGAGQRLSGVFLPAFSCLKAAVMVTVLLVSPIAVASEQPNVILILTDDQGYGDVSLHGNPVLKTPNLDQLAKESVRFTDFHVAPMCSPTRGQLMTGIDAMRNGCTAVCEGRSMMRSELPTMANYFAGSGYATGHFGKWHLGDSYPHRPQDRGFQETVHHRAWGITSLADHWENRKHAYFDPILLHNGKEENYEGYCTDIFFGEAMKWFEKQSADDKPFFCYIPTNTPHVPDICAEQYSKPYAGMHDGQPMPSKFYGMIANLDENIGKLEAFLKEKGLRDNTLLIYLSDNGTQSTQAKEIFNSGMREKKTSVYEGGHRVPLFVRWPEGQLAHGAAVEELTQVQDLLPTLIELCGLKKIDSPLPFDGMSLAGLLKGGSTGLPDRKLVVQYRESGEPWDPAVVMWNEWRLLRPKKGRNPQPPDALLELYHVGRDPGQQENVAADHPEVLAAMKQHYEKWHTEAKKLFDRPRWISVGTAAANPMVLYSQDWVGDYCDNPGGLSNATAHGYWNVDVEREGVYEIELRRWPKESNKTLTEGWAAGPGGVRRSARPITAANLQIANKNYTLDTQPGDRHASFRIRLSNGRTQLATLFLNAENRSLCSAIYVYLRRLSDAEADDAKLTPQSDRKPAGRAPSGRGKNASYRMQAEDILVAAFEGVDYGEWKATGEAFGTKPALGTLPRQMNVSGFKGRGLVNSFVGGDDATGTLTSPPFKIERPFLNFYIGGGRWTGQTCVNLLVDGKVVRSATGSNPGGSRTELLEPATWNVKRLLGKSATIQIVDRRKGGWGHISFDHLVQSTKAATTPVAPVILEELEKSLTVDSTHLIVPVANKGERLLMGIYEGERLVQNFTVALPKGDAPYWLAAYPLKRFDLAGKNIRIAPVDQRLLPVTFTRAFDLIRVGTVDDAHAADDYALPYRDQFHAGARRGWNNDPNGMVYHDGKYHLYFQHNPFGIGWGNMHWGRLESTDLIHWEEKPIALYQNTTGDMMFSGGGFVDFNNSAGLGENTLFVAFTSTGRGECLAYSKDGGDTFTELQENPVVKHKGRDPKIIWYQPEQKWVMAVYDFDPCEETKSIPARQGTQAGRINNNIAFYESKNLRRWKRTGAFTHADRDAVHECPELFEMQVEGKPEQSRWILYGAQNRYFIGDFDGKTFHMESGPHGDPRSPQQVGPPGGRGTMYAAQTFSNMSDGRRIQMGWLRTAPDLISYPDQIVSQSMSLPHEFTLRETDRGMRMFYQPVKELEELRAELLTEDVGGLASAEGKLTETLIEFENAGTHKLTINGIDASFDGRSARIFSDRNTNEVYIDSGLEYRTYRREPAQTGLTATKVVSRSAVTSLKVFRLKSIWGDAPKQKAAFAKPPRPNIVLIFIDDMGYGDIGPFGNKVNKTPNLDRMAKQGNVLRQFYVANTACTPSRAALLTGSYAHRIGMDHVPNFIVAFPGDKRGLNPDEITIAELLQDAGYATGCFGKWHLGDQPSVMPLKQGFDEYFGIPYSNDMWPGNKRGNPLTNRGPYEPLPVMRQDEAVAHVADGADQSLLCEVVTDEAVKFIRSHKDESFFCYVPHAYVHNPRFARPKFLERAEGNANRATVEEIDDSVGRILKTLRELKIAENTLVIFTSDNGGAGGMSMGPLRGGKGGPKYEGHMRVPTVAWWPGTIKAGSETEAIAVTTDLLPSFAKLAGAKVPDDRTIDGQDVVNVILGKPGARSPHDIHYYEDEGVRRGNWKLVKTRKKTELYNLENDLGERNDLATANPDIVKSLQRLLAAHAEHVASDTRPAAIIENPKPILTEPGDLPRLRDYVGLPNTAAGTPVRK